MSKFEFKEKDNKYTDITGEVFMNDIEGGIDIITALRQIAYNISHLADEVRALRKTYTNACDLLFAGEPDNEEATRGEPKDEKSEHHTEKSEHSERHEEEPGRKCLCCNKPLDIENVAVTFIDDDKTFYLCKDCDDHITCKAAEFIYDSIKDSKKCKK